MWNLEINNNTIKRLRGGADGGVNLLAIADGDLLRKLSGDAIFLADVVFAICRFEAEENGVTQESFDEAMAGDVIASARDALLGELVDFSQSPKDRENLRAAIDLVAGVADKERDRIAAMLVDPETKVKVERVIRKAIDEAMDEALGSGSDSSGNAPESSE